ncbi:MAG: hypothetical protein ACI4E1_11530 [Lachnospira sp.]
MIVFNVGDKIKAIISKMISVSGQSIEWNRQIAINNNTVVLPGKQNALLFNFDNRKIIETVLEEGTLKDPVDMPADKIAENATNILLYVFGKWGLIKGMRVEKDYEQLNALFNSILQEVSVSVEANDVRCKFYKDSIQITFEDVFRIIVNYLSDEEDDTELEQDINDKLKKQDTEENKLGLWHKLIWKNMVMAIDKKKLKPEDRDNDRMGMNFYKSAYVCPQCGNNLYMTVYKEGEEKIIETRDGTMYMTRCYTCHECLEFLTPKPDLLVIEGNEYFLDFDGDEDAYYDFLRLAGDNGGRFSNPKFNWMTEEKESEEEEYKRTPVNEILRKMLGMIDETTDSELITVADCADSGFFIPEEQDLIVKRAQAEMARRGMDINALPAGKLRSILMLDAMEFQKAQYAKKKEKEQMEKQSEEQAETCGEKQSEEQTETCGEKQNKEGHGSKVNAQSDEQQAIPAGKDDEGRNWSAKQVDSTRNFDDDVSIAVNLAKRNRRDEFEELIKTFSAKKLANTRNAINSLINMEIRNGHSQAESTRELETFEKRIASQLDSLMDGKLDLLFSQIPEKISKEIYVKLKKQLEEFDTDKSRFYLKKLRERWAGSEQQELLSIVAKSVKNGRNSIYSTCQQLEEDSDFSETAKRPVIQKMMEKVSSLDQEKIDRMCERLENMDFEQGLDLINDIKAENLLPELQENAIERIRRRLIQMKKDECGKLVRKLKRDTQIEGMTVPGFVVYDVRRMSKDTCEDTDAILFHNAVFEYASGAEYEFPLLMYDSTKAGNGKKGFVVTPDRIAYNLSSMGGSIDISDVKQVYAEYGVFNKGIYVQSQKGYKYKIANVIKLPKKEMEEVISKLDGFIKYLKEKPDSHNVEYLAKEKHEMKICVRCGFRYSDGAVCPKCGSKNL